MQPDLEKLKQKALIHHPWHHIRQAHATITDYGEKFITGGHKNLDLVWNLVTEFDWEK